MTSLSHPMTHSLDSRGRSRNLWRRWVAANALGELIGLGGAAAIGTLAATTIVDTESTTGALMLAAVMIATGIFEGIVVGWAQWWAMHDRFPLLRKSSWIAATVAGALAAWTLGMIPSTIMSMSADAASSSPPPEISEWLVYLLAAVMGMVLGPVIAFAQWIVLRRHVERVGLWIGAHAVAWMLGMPAIFVGVGAVGEQGVSPASVTIALVSIALAGAIVGAVHGLALMQLIRTPFRFDSHHGSPFELTVRLHRTNNGVKP